MPHGDIIIFGLWYSPGFIFGHVTNIDLSTLSYSCGQIMYAFLLRPDTMPKEYVSWYVVIMVYTSKGLTLTPLRIGQASKVPKEAVSINFDLIRKGTFDISEMQKVLARPVSRLSLPICPTTKPSICLYRTSRPTIARTYLSASQKRLPVTSDLGSFHAKQHIPG